jgi:hypothetical protein
MYNVPLPPIDKNLARDILQMGAERIPNSDEIYIMLVDINIVLGNYQNAHDYSIKLLEILQDNYDILLKIINLFQTIEEAKADNYNENILKSVTIEYKLIYDLLSVKLLMYPRSPYLLYALGIYIYIYIYI